MQESLVYNQSKITHDEVKKHTYIEESKRKPAHQMKVKQVKVDHQKNDLVLKCLYIVIGDIQDCTIQQLQLHLEYYHESTEE